MMRRYYMLRGERVEIEERDDRVALLSPGGVSGDEKLVADSQAEDAMGEEWRAFRKAGWKAVRPEKALVPPDDGRAKRIFIDEGGRYLLGSDRLTVRIQPEYTPDQARAMAAAAGLEVVNELALAPNLYEVRVAPGADFLDVAWELSRNPAVVYAEPQFIEHVPARVKPSDPYFGKQWHLSNSEHPGADIHAEAAWDSSRGCGVRVGVVDHGFMLAHPDLVGGVAATSAYFDNNEAGDTTFVQNPGRFPRETHGTACAGLVAARANNRRGGCGVAFEAEVCAVACLTDALGSQVTLARAVAYAADPSTEGGSAAHGAHVITCSLGARRMPWRMFSVLKDAIDLAVTRGRDGLGTPVFWAVNNDQIPITQDQVCAYERTITVGRSDREDRPGGSAYGPELDFLAPGVQIYSTILDSDYDSVNGSSYAAPIAAGIAALVLQVNPALTWEQLRDVMRASCDKVGGGYVNGRNDTYGYGRVNAARAVAAGAPQP